MKNTNSKTINTKLIAKMVLVAILLMNTAMLSSCFYIGGISSDSFTFYSHSEFAEFLQEYTSNKQNRFTPTFISFDFDDIDYIDVDHYNVSTIVERKRNIITKEVVEESIFESTHNADFSCRMIFFMVMDDYLENVGKLENTYRIECRFYTNLQYNFYQNDPMYIENFSLYGLKYIGYLCINDIREVEINIDCEYPTSQEKIDEITKLLMDNIVVINK